MSGAKWMSDRSWLKRGAMAICAMFIILLAGCSLVDLQTKTDGTTPAYLERQTSEGVVIGVENEATNTLSWKAIPYAKAPVGALRWRATQAPDKRTATLKADKFCEICPQYVDHDRNPATPQIVIGNEDCLYLNIWAPKNATGNLPVFFWIHGGGNSIQWPMLSLQDGGALANRGQHDCGDLQLPSGTDGLFQPSGAANR